MSPLLVSTFTMISKYAMMACTFNLVGMALQPLKVLVDAKVQELENNMKSEGDK